MTFGDSRDRKQVPSERVVAICRHTKLGILQVRVTSGLYFTCIEKICGDTDLLFIQLFLPQSAYSL